MNEIIKRSFDFNGHDLTVIIDNENTPWWIAKEVCDVLGIDPSNISKSLDDDEKGSYTIQTLGGPQNAVIINEPGLYSLIFRSRKEAAKAFKRWVTHDVLPTIRKTGGYQMQGVAHRLPVPQIKTDIEAAIELAKIFGLEGNQAKLSANTFIKNYHGVDCMAIAQITHIESSSKDVHLTPSDIGKQLGLSGQKANKVLEKAGLQVGIRSKKDKLIWQPTDKGKNFSVLKDTGKRHSDGTPVTQVFWLSSVVDVVKDSSI